MLWILCNCHHVSDRCGCRVACRGYLFRRGIWTCRQYYRGILGAIIAGALLPGYLHFSGIGGQIISAAIGAIILLFLVSLVRRMAR